ncbi:MAG: MltA domain-containing protein [Rickettsiales bacterium]|jgi:membrane-bound lytic murein transglycosylase A|nr:MltA domain-containing protein [Rickettsiales bacterium]
MFRKSGILLLFALGLASCRSSRLDDRIPFKKSEKKMNLEAVGFADLPNWSRDDAAAGLVSFRKSCAKILSEGDFIGTSQIVISADFMKEACEAAPQKADKAAAKAYFEEWFDPYKVSSLESSGEKGMITGYYEAEVEGELEPDCDNLVPIYGKPFDLPADGSAYKTRAQIENGDLRSRAPVLFWAKKPSEVHILHIQGSGVVKTKKGEKYRVGYAGNNGHKFSGIGSILMTEGVRPDGGYSMIAVKKWLDSNPKRARRLMQKNNRFIFFRDIDGDGPIGAMGVPLTPGRSIAVDTEFIPFGLPLFLATRDPDGIAIERLVVAQDTGAAIKGVVRADLFWGGGRRAFDKSGRMKSEGSYYILLPKDGKNFAVKK